MDRVILITGTSRGIGAALKAAFEKQDDVVLAHTRADHGDLRDRETIDRLKKRAVSMDVDTLINCAGIYSGAGIDTVTADEITDVIGVNLIALMQLTRAIWPLLVKNQGLMVNINSIAGRMPMGPNEIVYRTAKYGLSGFSYALAFQGVVDDVRVLDVPFGGINTDMLKGKRKDMEGVPELQPEAAADLIVQLVGNSVFENDELRHRLITGHGQLIDNGYMMKDGGKR